MTTFDHAAFSRAGTGRLALGFGPHLIRISAEETGGRVGVFECDVPPGEGPPPHIHDVEDEVFRVLEGRFAFWCNGSRLELDSGAVIVIPRGAVHTFRNVGPAAGRLMVTMTPGGFEGFFGAVEAEQPETPEAVEALARRFHLRFVAEAAANAA